MLFIRVWGALLRPPTVGEAGGEAQCDRLGKQMRVFCFLGIFWRTVRNSGLAQLWTEM